MQPTKFCCLSLGGTSDVCDGYSEESLLDSVHKSATPQGGTEAGVYIKGIKFNGLFEKVLISIYTTYQPTAPGERRENSKVIFGLTKTYYPPTLY